MNDLIRLLLIEDDPADARFVEVMLRRLPGSPFSVETVDRLSVARQMVAQERFQVVLADLSLPDSHGLDTLRSLTGMAPDLPVVVLTGNDDDSQAIEALKHGAQDYLVKGRSDGMMLSRVIRYAIERKATERALTEARDRAQAAVRAKSVFLAMVGHEIRTPLNGILGMSKLLLDTDLDVKQRTFAEIVASSGELLLGLVNDILDFSKLEAEALTLEQVGFDIFALVEDLRLLLAPRAAEKGISLGCRFAPTIPAWVEGDPLRLRQVLLNLVGNAIKFTETGGVTISALREEQDDQGRIWLKFQVTDTGIGIPEQSHPDLFIEFSQADSSITRRFGGTGLGLAISKKIVELMGGAIGFESTLGKGSTFWFKIPVVQGDEADRPGDVNIPDLPPARVLLVDDNAVNREVAAGLLERHGHRVISVGDGPSGVAALQRECFDLILLDMRMPGMDGIETARRMRALGGHAGTTPLWLLTANPQEQDAPLWAAAGIDGCLAKPFRVEQALRLLAKAEVEQAGTPVPQAFLSLPDFLADMKDLGRDRMAGLVDLFRRSSAEDLALAKKAGTQGDMAELASLVHRMASSSSSLYLNALHQQCRIIEDQARSHDPMARVGLDDLDRLWHRSVAALDEIIG